MFLKIPFHKPAIGDDEILETVNTLKSGWLTTGPKTKQFEQEFADYVGVKHAIALNSATAALHLALEAIGLQRGETVLVPTMTFAATAEVVRYFDAKPILIDCREGDFNLDCGHAFAQARAARIRGEKIRAIIPMHYGGNVCEMKAIQSIASEYDLNIIEDAAHCCPAFYRDSAAKEWKSVGAESAVCCYSFYANKCITTGEGGMACTNNDQIGERIRIMALHGISKDAWKRFTSEGSWYYEIIAPGYKYNLTDIAASIGLHQLRKADRLRVERERVALNYHHRLAQIPLVVGPEIPENRIHSWHLFVIRLRLEEITIDRSKVIELLKEAGIGTSVHWMPLHLHPYYRDLYGYRPEDFPTSTRIFQEIISLPIFPAMQDAEVAYVCDQLAKILMCNRK